MRTYYPFRIGGFIVLGVAAFAAFTLIVMLLWNWLIPAIFSGTVITFWQAAGLLLLSKILFSGVWKGHHSKSGDRNTLWRKKFEEKMNKMSEEEREKFKSRFHNKWFHHGPFGEKKEKEEE